MKKHLDETLLKRSLVCAELCNESYGLITRHDEVRAICVKLLNSKEECFTSFLAEFQDTQAMVLNTEDEIYLVFPGTDSETDILTDVTFELVRYGSGHVHRSFLDVAQKTYPKIIEAVKRLLAFKPDAKVIVTGHSLGGALAMLYAEMLRGDGIEVTQLITFGQPRVGNGKFAKGFSELEIPYIRFVNETDIVPDVPPPYDKHDWTHSGTRLTFGKDGILEGILSDETAALTRSIETIIRVVVMWFQNARKFDEKLKKAIMETVDHLMAIYLKNVKALPQ
jgi:predicted lipase